MQENKILCRNICFKVTKWAYCYIDLHNNPLFLKKTIGASEMQIKTAFYDRTNYHIKLFYVNKV